MSSHFCVSIKPHSQHFHKGERCRRHASDRQGVRGSQVWITGRVWQWVFGPHWLCTGWWETRLDGEDSFFILLTSKWQLYSNTRSVSQSFYIFLHHICFLLVKTMIITTEFLCGKLMQTLVIWLWRKRVEKQVLAVVEVSSQLSPERMLSLLVQRLRLKATPHHPYTSLLFGSETKSWFCRASSSWLTHSRLSPWHSGHQVHLSSHRAVFT